MNSYQSPDDLLLAQRMVALALMEAKAFLAFDHAAKRADGEIPPKIREWIALAVALTTQCGYCLDVHSRAAKSLGTTEKELAEIVLIAAAVRAGATVGHGLLTLRLFDQAPAV
jgi:AhpD family alkylhydroperoxidase